MKTKKIFNDCYEEEIRHLLIRSINDISFCIEHFIRVEETEDVKKIFSIFETFIDCCELKLRDCKEIIKKEMEKHERTSLPIQA